MITLFRDQGIWPYASEPGRRRRNWKKKPNDKATVYANRRRSVESAANGCCVSGTCCWNSPAHTLWKLAACDGFISGTGRTFSNAAGSSMRC